PPPDPLAVLIDFHRLSGRPVVFVPELVFFSKSPPPARLRISDLLFGSEDRPRLPRLLYGLFRNPGGAFVELSPPLDLAGVLARPGLAGQPAEFQAALLRGEILALVRRHRRSITGPVPVTREEIRERILNRRRFQEFLREHAARGGSFEEMRRRAEAIVDEIAADQRPGWIRFYSGIDGWILRALFAGIRINRGGLEAVKRLAVHGPVIYLPAHRSHADYLLLSYVLYHNDLTCPLVAAGKNLSFWPLGPLFRRGGAFFIRRRFRGDVLYARVFAEYIHTVLEAGYCIEQFIEGGRSRTGKLLVPRLGLLSMLLGAYRDGACEDLILAPVAIGYDRVPEESSYLHEIEGGQKRPESLGQLLRARRALRRRHGNVYVQFGAPFSLRELENQEGAPLSTLGREAFQEFVRRTAQRVAEAINRASVVTAHALVAAALLHAGRERLERAEIGSRVEIYLAYLEEGGAPLTETLIADPRRAVSEALADYVERRILEARRPAAEGGEAEGFLLRPARRGRLEYYKNTCMHAFLPAAYTALAVLQQDAFQFTTAALPAETAFLRDLFQLEFVGDPGLPDEELVGRSLAFFVRQAALVPHPSLPDTYNLTAAGYRTLRLFAMFLKTFLEAYRVALTGLLQEAGGAGDRERDRVRAIAALGRTMLRDRLIDHPEALSRVSLENAVSWFTGRAPHGAGHREWLLARAAVIDRALRSLKGDG
ncbi:MAG: 1-acyl-sn-glycerol-3-phosphate acyltransferase, partial [Desulfobacterales bacterium]